MIWRHARVVLVLTAVLAANVNADSENISTNRSRRACACGWSYTCCDTQKRLTGLKDECIHNLHDLDVKCLTTGLYFFSSFKLPWIGAVEYCRNHGMDLVCLDFPAKNRELVQYINSMASPGKSYWLGGTQMVARGVWRWHCHGHPFDFTWWINGAAPNDSDLVGGVEVPYSRKCASLVMFPDANEASIGPAWKPWNCEAPNLFVCQVQPPCEELIKDKYISSCKY